MRVLAAKIRVGVIKNKLVNVETVDDVLQAKESSDSAQKVSDRAVTLLRNEGERRAARRRQPCLRDRRRAEPGVATAALASRRNSRAALRMLASSLWIRRCRIAVAPGRCRRDQQCSAIVVSADVTWRRLGRRALGGDLPPFIQKLTEGPVPVVLVAMGNPYLLVVVSRRWPRIWRPSASRSRRKFQR